MITGRCTERKIANRSEEKTCRNEEPRVALVRNRAHQKFAEPVGKRGHRRDVADHFLRVAERLLHLDRDERDVVAHEVKDRVADVRRLKRPEPELRIEQRNLRFRKPRRSGRRRIKPPHWTEDFGKHSNPPPF
jgi:hypothetical protein